MRREVSDIEFCSSDLMLTTHFRKRIRTMRADARDQDGRRSHERSNAGPCESLRIEVTRFQTTPVTVRSGPADRETMVAV